MRVRPLVSSDRASLASFTCSDGTPRQNDVESWIRKKSVGWVNSSPSNEAWVLVDDADEICGVYAFEPGDDDDGRETWFVRCVAIRADHQDGHVGMNLLTTCLGQLQDRSPDGQAWWKVDASNVKSHSMSTRVGAQLDPTAPSAKISTYFVNFS